MDNALWERFTEDMTLRNFAPKTRVAYMSRAKRFAEYYGRSPREMGEAEVRAYLLHLIDCKLSASTLSVGLGALRFLYAVTLGRPGEIAKIPVPKRPRLLPEILSLDEAALILSRVRSVKHRATLMLAYGAGLRISEIRHLKIADIDSKRMLIAVRGGKGYKDRLVMLSPRLLEVLRAYYKFARPKGPYLFPGRDGERPLSSNAIRSALAQVLTECGLKKHLTPHSLRHGFATHLLEAGNDIRVIQRLLGHASIQSTAHYARVTPMYVATIESPLELVEKRGAQTSK